MSRSSNGPEPPGSPERARGFAQIDAWIAAANQGGHYDKDSQPDERPTRRPGKKNKKDRRQRG